MENNLGVEVVLPNMSALDIITVMQNAKGSMTGSEYKRIKNMSRVTYNCIHARIVVIQIGGH